jgi:hypothetical protein
MMGLFSPIAVIPVGLEVIVYNMMGLPFEIAAVKLIVVCRLPATAVTAVGAPDTVPGITPLDGLEFGPVPAALIAATTKV